MTTGPKSKFTEAQIRTVTEAQKIIGTRPLSRATGIHRATIHKWKKMDENDTLDIFIEEKCQDQDQYQNYQDQHQGNQGLTVSPADTLDQFRAEKKQQFIEAGWNLALKILETMNEKMAGASFKDLAVGFGVVFDKIALAAGEVTSRSEHRQTTVSSREELLIVAAQISEKVKELPGRRGQTIE